MKKIKFKNLNFLLTFYIILLLSSISCDSDLIILFDEASIVDSDSRCRVSDVVLLLDTTTSMNAAIDSVKEMLTGSIIPGLASAVNDLNIGIATFEDIPVIPHGSPGDLPFKVVQKITNNFTAAQTSVNNITLGGGDDQPESYVEALYLMSTNQPFGSWFSPTSCPAGTQGAMCFRDNATPIIILITDAPTHNGPGNSSPYSAISPTPHSYNQAITALNDIGAHVIVIHSGIVPSYPEMSQLATDTGGVDASGNPIVLKNISSTGSSIIDIIGNFCFQ